MSEMVEKVAKAIYEQRNGYGCRAWGNLPQLHRAPYLQDAQAAIKTLRAAGYELAEPRAADATQTGRG